MPKQIIIYTTTYCPFCARAKSLLKQKNIPFKEIDVTNNSKAREEIEKKTGQVTVPVIFIGDEFIGGSDELYALNASGKLDEKLNLSS